MAGATMTRAWMRSRGLGFEAAEYGTLLTVDAKKPSIVFVESCPAYGPSGGVRAATCYNFQVEDEQVTVEVDNRAMHTGGGIMPPEKVKRAAKCLLENEIEQRQSANLPNRMILDSPTMDALLVRLRHAPRF
jgi:hypothetical protein